MLPIMTSLAADPHPRDYSPATARLEQLVREEMRLWSIGGVAVALVDEQRLVYAAGFGEADRDSVFRCGSISKLFNAVALMQLVEAHRLDLDAPFERYAPGLLPVNPFTNHTSVTLRQLLCHRSGMIREAPVGGYFDDAHPGLNRTVSSVAQTVLVNPPNSKTRYSNVGPSLAGRLLELLTGDSFPHYQHVHLLGPMGMVHSAWLLKDLPSRRLVPSHIRVADGQGGFHHRTTPVFDLGTIPAGNLYTSAPDLARFLTMLAAEGDSPGGRILQPASLTEMFTAQFVQEPGAFGLGFMVGSFQGHKLVSHSGAVYGHSSTLVFLPEVKLGAVVLANEDLVNARVQHLANAALSLMLQMKCGEPVPSPPQVVPSLADDLRQFVGEYESQSYWARLGITTGTLAAEISGQQVRLIPIAPGRFLAESRIHDAVPLVFERTPQGQVSGFTLGPQVFIRVPVAVPPVPATWHAYLGEYGPDFIPLVVSTRHGHLYAMTENLMDYRLTPINRQVFAFPPGLYVDEQLVFLCGRRGRPHSVNLANMILPKR
jgi:CubicO group peptidase (beta-lactamase class C family)